MSFEKNFLDVMTLDEIRDKVNACHPGSWHRIMIVDGAPITLDSTQTLYVTETFNIRFKISYGELPIIKFRDKINSAKTPEEVAECRDIYNGLKHKEVALATSVAELEKKERMVAKGIPLSATTTTSKNTPPKQDQLCPSINHCKNGSITLTCYTSFRNKIRRFKGGFKAEELPSVCIRYFIKENDSIVEIFDDNTDPKYTEALQKARAQARASAKKRNGGKPTAIFKPKVTNILHIW